MTDPRTHTPEELEALAAREAARRVAARQEVAKDVNRLAETRGPNRAERRARARRGYNVARSLNTPYRKREAS